MPGKVSLADRNAILAGGCVAQTGNPESARLHTRDTGALRPLQEMCDLEMGEPLSPADIVSCGRDWSRVSHEAAYFTMSSLEEMQPTLTHSIVGALLPQLRSLKENLRQLRAYRADQPFIAKASTKSPRHAYRNSMSTGVEASALASAVCDALNPTLDVLEQKAAVALQTPRIQATDVQLTPKLAVSVASELLPQIKGPVTEAIDNIVEMQLKACTPRTPMMSPTRSPVERSPKIAFNSTVVEQEFTSSTSASSSLMLSLPLPEHGSSSPSSNSTPVGGITRRHSSLSRNKQPARAFVVNFRRLVQVQKILSLIHLIIKSTAIATLTLVSSAYWTDLLFSISFVGLVLALYAIHEIRYDRMDIADYKSLGNLLEDDIGWRNNQLVENPNRLLKALSLGSNHRRRARAVLTVVIAVLITVVMWVNVFWSWVSPPKDDGLWLGLFNEYDVMVQATQLLIGTVMVCFHIAFELLYWRETQCVMPWDSKRSQPMDPREKHGRSFSQRWLGLPSMWFTSREAYDDLRLWITLSRFRSKDQFSHIVSKIFPEEMALFALDPDNACDLRKTLRHAKLFSLADWKFLVRNDPDAAVRGKNRVTDALAYRAVKASEEPEELGIELALYDSATGQFLEPHPHAEYRSSLMQLLKTPKAVRDQQAEDPWDDSQFSPQSAGRETTGDSMRLDV
jgi:hypothetical protein